MSLVRTVQDNRANRESTRFKQFTREAGVPEDMWASALCMLPLFYFQDSSFFTQGKLQEGRKIATSKHLTHGNSEAGILFFFIRIGANR